MNEADWTPSPVGEREALLRRRRLVQHDALALTVGAVGLVAGAILVVALAFHFFTNGLVLMVAVVAAFLTPFFVAQRVDRRRDALLAALAEIDQSLREEFGPGHGWLVDLIVLHGKAPAGTDRGMLWIEEGRLMYSGHRTSFALAPAQIVGAPRLASPIRGLRHGVTIPLDVRLPAGRLAVSVGLRSPLPQNPGYFEHSLQEWARGSAAAGGQLPPTAPGPGLASRPRVLAHAIASALFWAGVAALMLRIGPLGPVLLVPIGAAAIAWILHLGYPFTRLRAWYDLGKVGPLPDRREG